MDEDPTWIVLRQGPGQLKGLVQHLQDQRAGAREGEGLGDPLPPPGALRGPCPGSALTSPTIWTVAPSFLSLSMVRAGVVLGTTMVAGIPSVLAA